MTDHDKNEKSLLDNLLPLSPEEVLRGLPLEIRSKLSPLLAALDLLEDKTLSEEERDEMLAIAKRSATGISQMLALVQSYFRVRDENASS